MRIVETVTKTLKMNAFGGDHVLTEIEVGPQGARITFNPNIHTPDIVIPSSDDLAELVSALQTAREYMKKYEREKLVNGGKEVK